VTTPSQLLDLSGQTVLVTGATGGLGRGIAERLAEAGAHIVVHSGSSLARAENEARQLIDAGYKAEAVKADLTQTGEIVALVDTLKTRGPMPRLLINNAGVQPVTPLTDITPDEWQAVMSANLGGAVLLTQLITKALISAQHSGAVVNIASIEGTDPAKGHAHYATSKAGLIMFTRAAALEYGPHNIRVNSVSPGLIHRDGLEADWPSGVKSWQDNAPLTRLGTPKDIANAVLFLLSPTADWISGSNLVVDGGMSANNRW